MRSLVLLSFLAASAGCFVDVSLQGRACDDAHPCVEGYLCVERLCFAEELFSDGAEHGACRAQGAACDPDLSCVDGRCAGVGPLDAGQDVDAGEDGARDAGPEPDAGPAIPAPALLDDDVIAYWSFNNDPADDVIEDFAGSLDGEARGPGGAAARPLRVEGAFASALRFDGSDDIVTVPPAAALDLGARFSVEVLVRVAGICESDEPLVGRISSGPGWNLSCRHAAGVPFIRAAFRDIAGFVPEVTSPVRVDDGEWHHVVLVRDVTTLTLYVDGVAETVTTQLGGTDNDSLLHIGGHEGGGVFFNGDLDELRLWRRALSPDEVAALHAAFRPGLIAFWTFEGNVLNLGGAAFPGAAQQVLLDDGLRGRGVRFDGLASVIHVATLPDSMFGASYTASLWFRTTAVGEQQLLFDGEGGYEPLNLWVDATAVRARLAAPSAGDVLQAELAGSFTDGAWHHVVLARDGADGEPTTLRLFVDGTLATPPAPVTYALSYSDLAGFEMGYATAASPRRFAGDLDEVQLWTRALSDEEVAAAYAARP